MILSSPHACFDVVFVIDFLPFFHSFIHIVHLFIHLFIMVCRFLCIQYAGYDFNVFTTLVMWYNSHRPRHMCICHFLFERTGTHRVFSGKPFCFGRLISTGRVGVATLANEESYGTGHRQLIILPIISPLARFHIRVSLVLCGIMVSWYGATGSKRDAKGEKMKKKTKREKTRKT